MFGRQERVAIALLLSVAVIVVVSHLVLDQIGKRPFVTPYSGESVNGDLVSLSGAVETVILTKNGGNCILVVDNMSVFIPNSAAAGRSFLQGMNISVIGTVQSYQGKREIAVRSASDIVIPDT